MGHVNVTTNGPRAAMRPRPGRFKYECCGVMLPLLPRRCQRGECIVHSAVQNTLGTGRVTEKGAGMTKKGDLRAARRGMMPSAIPPLASPPHVLLLLSLPVPLVF
jgi:hypothetical protein